MKIYFETMGCPKNFNDTQAAQGILEREGFEIAAGPEESDVIIVNTCGFINDAKTESIGRIFELSDYKEASPGEGGADGTGRARKLVVSGCLSKRYSQELLDEMPEVDLFLGVNEYEKLPEILRELEAGGERKTVVSEDFAACLPVLPRKLADKPYTATLKIAEGCDNCCAYCVIPSIRGGFRSKKKEDVIAEAEMIAQAVCSELILIAQDVTNYGMDLYGHRCLHELVEEVCKVDGIHWVRLMYCYEDRITDELIEVMAREAKVCHYIDIPIQHCSDAVLRGMKRRSTKKSIMSTIERLREAIPDIHIRTTFIVGFPGETEEDYEELCDFVDEVQFDRLGVFAYSQEENTVAGEREDQIDEEVKAERADGIMRQQIEISLASNQDKVGQVLEVLVESMDEEGAYIGRTEYDAPEIDNSVIFTSERQHAPGDFVKVLINDAFDYDLVGMEV
ncbi:MAG: 30S ribosomal protein S12 methylthiotransferase RimO [Firmicutes bacterium]|nr:30S ribosomal protein S12 methylthiotransferase RimO [Bacillota bacterium]